MKKTNLIIACAFATGALTACNSSSDSSANGDTAGKATAPLGDTMNNATNSTPPESSSPSTAAASKTPFAAKDSTFVMKAAVGGMMEVQAGQLAQQNGASDRVKAYGGMMVRDHGAANQELATLAASHGMMVPSALPPDKQKHIDDMQKMTGKDFDKHYVKMMVEDHVKDVAEFDKQSRTGEDADLKAWAGKTLPTLKMHKDSITAISKSKM